MTPGLWVLIVGVCLLLAVHGAVMPETSAGKVFFAIFQPAVLILALIYGPTLLGAK